MHSLCVPVGLQDQSLSPKVPAPMCVTPLLAFQQACESLLPGAHLVPSTALHGGGPPSYWRAAEA